MRPQLHDQLAALPARQLNLIAIGVVAIVLLLAWTVGLRAPLAAYRQHSAALAALETGATTPAAGAQPHAPGAPAAVSMPAPLAPEPLALVGAISRSATQGGVTVSSAAQGAERTLAGVRLRTIDVAASGSYAAIVDWLGAIERQQPTVGINALALEADDHAERRMITLQLVIYDTGTPP